MLDIIISMLETVREIYINLFGNFLHVHFFIRTAFLLLLAWLVILLFIKMFIFIFGPCFVLMFYHIFFRIHNYFFVETPAEWIYIRYYSNDLPTLEKLYIRLSDKIKKNRETLNKLSYGRAILKVKRTENKLSYFLLTMSTLWFVAFGLYIEFFTPPPPLSEIAVDAGLQGPVIPGQNIPDETYLNENEIRSGFIYIDHVYSPGIINPYDWEPGENIILVLNEEGRRHGVWLRNGPGITGFIVTEVLWGDVILQYLHYYMPDVYVNGLFWLRVRTPEGNTGYLSSSLVEVYN